MRSAVNARMAARRIRTASRLQSGDLHEHRLPTFRTWEYPHTRWVAVQNGIVDQDKVYHRIGKFVACFQFIEDQLRQIG